MKRRRRRAESTAAAWASWARAYKLVSSSDVCNSSKKNKNKETAHKCEEEKEESNDLHVFCFFFPPFSIPPSAKISLLAGVFHGGW
jgi:hypothetical protein